MIWQYSGMARLFENISAELKKPTEYNMIKNSVNTIPCSCGRVYQDKPMAPTKSWGEADKSVMADHKWKEKGSHLSLWYQAKIIDKKNTRG